MNVFTGSTGNIGQHIDKGFVPLKTRLERPVAEMSAELAAIKPQARSFLHLAGLVLVSECEKDPSRAHELNVEGSKRWFEAAARAGVRHFVFASTSHVYGKPEPGRKVKTTDPTKPVNAYGKSKLDAEWALSDLAHKFPETKLTIARIFSVLPEALSPGFLLTGLHQRAKNKDFSPIPGLYSVRDFMHARDVARDLIRIASWRDAPAIVHVCTGQGQRVAEIATQVFKQYGLSIDGIEPGPPSEKDITWIVGEPTPIRDT